MRYCLAFVLTLYSYGLFSQVFLDDVDINQVPYQSIFHYLDNLKSLNINTFTEIKPSCNNENEVEGFGQSIRQFKIKSDIENVWNSYKIANPSDTWQSRMICFGFMYSRNTNSLMYRNNIYSGINEGQIIYVNLKLLKGFFNLATAFEIVDVDNENKIIEFSYIEGGKAKGIQILHFIPTPKGETIITHTSYFKSDSKFRDKWLYCHFHNKIINQFHRNVKRMIYDLDQEHDHVYYAR